jgi:hypothetical protein
MDYITKHRLEEAGTWLNTKEFLNDLIIDFLSLVEFQMAQPGWSYERFNQCVGTMVERFELLRRGAKHGYRIERVWGPFVRNIITPTRWRLFGAESRQRLKQYVQLRERGELQDTTFEAWMLGLYSVQSVKNAPQDAFKVLGINPTHDITTIRKQFKACSLRAHPDHGGSNEQFQALIEAKNRCLAWAQGEATT